MVATNKIIAGLCAAFAVSSAMAQSHQPTKTAPTAGIEYNWRYGLSGNDVRTIEQIARGKSDEDRWMVYTAIVRNREASRDIFKGEPLSTDKVLANVRVRMSTEESQKWTKTWSHLNSWDRMEMIRVLRDDLALRH
jgi:hypothetical protein